MSLDVDVIPAETTTGSTLKRGEGQDEGGVAVSITEPAKLPRLDTKIVELAFVP